MEIRYEDLRIDSFRAGIHPPRVYRVTHIPTGIVIDEAPDKAAAVAEIKRLLGERERLKTLSPG